MRRGTIPSPPVRWRRRRPRRGEYWEHSDPGVDLAVFRTPHFKGAKYTVVPLSVIATREDFRTHNIQTTARVVLPGLLMFNIGSTRLVLGVLHGFYPAQPREVVSVPADTKQTFAENSNIAIVFPSWLLREIVESKAVDDHLKRLVAEQK